jgi:predicted dinucleotide-binding enzyme
MTTIGLIGAGNIGSTVARLAVVAELGERARAATPQEAAEAGDVVVVTIPLKAIDQVPVEPLRGKVVIDTNNYYPQRDGHIAALDEETTTTAELLQAHLPESKVVKGFNNIHFTALAQLARPHGDPERSVLAIAGDDAEAKATVTKILDDLGYDAHDVGPLSEGWRFQRDTAAYAALYSADPPGTWPPQQFRRVDEAFLVEQLGKAERYRDM